MLRRNIIFGGFIVLAIVGVSVWQLLIQGGDNIFWYKIAHFSSLSFFSAYYYNLIQALVALFVCLEVVIREGKRDTMEVLTCRPMRNSEYCIGRFWGVFKLFVLVNVCMLLVGMCLNVFIIQASFRFEIYLFYLITLSIPTLVFVLGCSLCIAGWGKSRALSVFILVGWGIGAYFYLQEWQFGMFDFWGRDLPNMFTDVVGHSDLKGYLLHRGIFLAFGFSGFFFWMTRIRRSWDYKEH